MAIESKTEAYNWILSIIKSCNNDFHFDCVDKLIELYHEKYLDSEIDTLLKTERANVWNNIHSILY
jgi:hypothetical protein